MARLPLGGFTFCVCLRKGVDRTCPLAYVCTSTGRDFPVPSPIRESGRIRASRELMAGYGLRDPSQPGVKAADNEGERKWLEADLVGERRHAIGATEERSWSPLFRVIDMSVISACIMIQGE